MSHVVELDLGADQQITELFAIKTAAERCGMEFLEGKKSFKYWGHAQEPCAHAMRLQNGREMGLVPSADNPGAFGIKLDDMDIPQTQDLLMYYQMSCAELAAQANGDVYSEEKQEDGSFVVTVDTSARMGS